MIDGAEVVTVEDLAEADGQLHPVQAAMVEHHGSQCGFCTPGFVMSLFTLYQATERRGERAHEVNDWIAGNLCRCTGYRPIVDAAIAACAGPRRDSFAASIARHGRHARLPRRRRGRLHRRRGPLLRRAGQHRRPRRALRAPSDATIVAGATDVGLWITKQLRDLPKIIHVGRARGFDRSRIPAIELLIGAGATYAQVEPLFPRPRPGSRRDCCAGSAPSRCARAARSAATSPTARRSATRRRP